MERKGSFSELSSERREHLARLAYKLLGDTDAEKLTIVCDQYSWSVNKALACAAVPPWRWMTKSHEHQYEVIVDNTSPPCGVHALMCYLTDGDYDDDEYDEEEFVRNGWANDIVAVSSLLFNCWVMSLADNYAMTALRDLALRKIHAQVEQEVCRPAFPTVVKLVFGLDTMDTQPHVIIDACIPHAEKILAPESWLTTSELYTYDKLRRLAQDDVAFLERLQAAAPQAGSTACGHDCAAHGCASFWHICRCRACWKEVDLANMTLIPETTIYCPSCGSAGCIVVESEIEDAAENHSSTAPAEDIEVLQFKEDAGAVPQDQSAPGMRALKPARFLTRDEVMMCASARGYPIPFSHANRRSPSYRKGYLLRFQDICKEKPSLDWDDKVKEIPKQSQVQSTARAVGGLCDTLDPVHVASYQRSTVDPWLARGWTREEISRNGWEMECGASQPSAAPPKPWDWDPVDQEWPPNW